MELTLPINAISDIAIYMPSCYEKCEQPGIIKENSEEKWYLNGSKLGFLSADETAFRAEAGYLSGLNNMKQDFSGTD